METNISVHFAFGNAAEANAFLAYVDKYGSFAPPTVFPSFDLSAALAPVVAAPTKQPLTVAQIGELDVGTNVDWAGAKYQFAGEVLDVDPTGYDDDDNVTSLDLTLRRYDTGKKVVIRDIDSTMKGKLTLA